MSGITLYTSSEMNVPRIARGYGNDEFLNFTWNPNIESSRFEVLVEDLSGFYKSLGSLKERVYIPAINFPNQAKLIVVGRNKFDKQVRFIGILKRGNLYTLDSSDEGDHVMKKYLPQCAFY